MKLATATVNDVQTEAIKRFAARVEERSEGRIKTELYPAAQLGSNARMIEGLQFGTVEFYTGPAAYLVGVDSRFQVTDLPAIFEDARHAQRVFSDPTFRETFLNLGADKGLVGLGTYIYGNTAFATAFPGDTVEAFNGKKLRVLASKVERKGVELMGATAVPIDFSEVATALQQGTVDGMKSSPPAFTSLKLYDIVKHITATEDGVMGEVMMVSKIWWDTLPEDLKPCCARKPPPLSRSFTTMFWKIRPTLTKPGKRWAAQFTTFLKTNVTPFSKRCASPFSSF